VLLFLFAVIVIYFYEKKRETKFLIAAVLFITAAVVQNRFLVELGALLVPKGK
jgi:hypothetical protein